jgi:hypothetical protein
MFPMAQRREIIVAFVRGTIVNVKTAEVFQMAVPSQINVAFAAETTIRAVTVTMS